MEFSTKAGAPERQRTGCVVVGVFEPNHLTEAAKAVDRAAKGRLTSLMRKGDLRGRLGATLWLHGLAGVAAERVLVVGLGKEDGFGPAQYREAVRSAARVLTDSGAPDAVFYLADLRVDGQDPEWNALQLATVVGDAIYRFDRLKSKKEEPKRSLRFALGVIGKPPAALGRGLDRGKALAAGMTLAKDLGNLPSNLCTPTYLAQQAQELAKKQKLKCQVLEEKDMQKLGMGALLAVTRGSREPAKLIVLEYQGRAKSEKPVVLVGKGITFDTGGISLKPSAEMDEMKYDMSGAGSVLGTLRAVSEMKLPINVVGIIPTCENMPDGNATKPGDIVTSLSGQTIEILNTDAEGRLILCDALTFAERFKPAVVIDIATLTGACVIALGHVASGLFANDDKLAEELLEAGRTAWDRAWLMPLWEDYQEQIKSPFADMANIGGRPAGSVTAACFLSRYAKNFRWAHLDVAGTAWRSGRDKGSTARPVPLLTTFLMQRASG
ncbi:MAG: leucyl aminopeptidase, partial [Proteobacteria bacterium]